MNYEPKSDMEIWAEIVTRLHRVKREIDAALEAKLITQKQASELLAQVEREWRQVRGE